MNETQVIELGLLGKAFFWMLFIGFVWGLTKMSDYKDPACGWVGHQ